MPVQVSHPGVYIEEIPSASKTVGGVGTSTSAFVDFFPRGPLIDEESGKVGKAIRVFNFREFSREFGGLDKRSEGSYAIWQFFNNGGQDAFVVRADDGTSSAARRYMDVNVPTLQEFALDAESGANAAEFAAFQALRVSDLSTSIAKHRESGIPAFTAGENASRLAASISEQIPDTRRGLLARQGELKDALGAAEAALAQARKGGAEDDALKDTDEAVAQAHIAFGSIDPRDAASLMQVDLANAVPLVKTAAEKAGALAAGLDSEAFEDVGAVVETLVKAVEGLSEAQEKLRTGYHISGFGVEEAAARLSEVGDEEADKVRQEVGEAVRALQAVGSLPDAEKADTWKAAIEKIRVARQRARRLEEIDLEEDARKTYAAAAIEAIQEAAPAAAAVVRELEPRLGEQPEHAKALVESLGASDDALARARTSSNVTADSAVTDINACIDAVAKAKEAVLATAKAGTDLIHDQLEIGGTESWPAVAVAAEVTAKLTDRAADATERAGDAAMAAAKVLAQRVTQARAKFGAIGKAARDAAREAAVEADNARKEAKNASESADAASALVNFGADGEVLDTGSDPQIAIEKGSDAVIDAASAAEKAANAANKAAERAADAHIAARTAGDAGSKERIIIEAVSPGEWGNSLRAVVLRGTQYRFDLQVQEVAQRNGKQQVINTESYSNLTLQDSDDPQFAENVVNHQSKLVRLKYTGPVVRGAQPIGDGTTMDPDVTNLARPLNGGMDGGPPGAEQLDIAMKGALENLAPNIFNILCLPITATYGASEASVAIQSAINYCTEKRAFMIVDPPPDIRTVEDMLRWMKKYGNLMNYCAAAYFPRLKLPDPIDNYRDRNVGPSGTMAGVYARTDMRRGIWKAPAGTEAVLQGVELASKLTDNENGILNPLGINVLRSFPVYGNISWGARTLAGADQLQSEWKYINVRRLISYIEESLFQALKWAVFEGNDEKLWREIKQQVGKFLSGLFSDGAFAGSSPDKAYYVDCDSSTTTQDDIDRGIVNIVIGVAPIKPAEFVVLHLEQIAGHE